MDGIKVEGAQVLFTVFGLEITQTVLSLTIVTAVLMTLGILLGRNLQKRPGKMQVLTEMGVKVIHDLVCDVMGKHNASWVPFIGTVFLSSIFGTLIGLTGFLRSTTADLAVVLTWSIMTSVIIWYQNIKRLGFVGWLKGFTEPIVVMTPMNIVGEIAQPLSMAFRHFGNVAGGGVITTIIYAALSAASAMILNLVAKSGWLMGTVLIVAGILLVVLWKQKKKLVALIFGIICAVIGLFGLLQGVGVLSGVPILTYGVPAVLSCYFDLFSGFVQAYVFSLLTMVYITGSLPEPGQAAN
jgi:F-type H+-transporting ATPase subunit a